ncbi:MAG: PepSY domain-containing protein [Pseudomonadales bacterium]|nr:PepSY domain-containing protein [Pseudomonadales bacterium]
MTLADLASSQITLARTKAQSSRVWFDWHSWLGVVTGLLLFIVCWGGTFATLSYELDWLVNPDQRVQAVGEAGSLEDIYQSVAEAYPSAVIQNVYAPLYRNFAAEVAILNEFNQSRRVYVDPYTLEVTGEGPFLNIQRYLRDFHRRLFTGSFGFYLICLASFPLIGSLITSLVFYKRWWRRFFEFKSARTVRTFVSNLHRLVGLWALWFVFIISVTGAWYMFERIRSFHIDDVFAYSDAIPTAVVPIEMLEYDSNTALPFDTLLAIAREARPDIDIAYVTPNRNGYFYVVGQASNILVRNRANKIFLLPETGEIVYNQHGEDLSPYWYWSNMADPVHFGNFGGLTSKVIWFAFGLILSFLSLSGVWLFAKRLSRSSKFQTKALYTIVALIAVSLWFLLNSPDPFIALAAQTGEQAQQLVPGVRIFLYSWLIVTSLMCLSWVYLVIANYKHAEKQGVPGSGPRSA